MLFTSFFQVTKRREKLLNYMLFLRVTPTLPNTFINLASPIVDVPYHIFFFATLIGLIPAAYVTVRVNFLFQNHTYCTSFLNCVVHAYDYPNFYFLKPRLELRWET